MQPTDPSRVLASEGARSGSQAPGAAPETPLAAVPPTARVVLVGRAGCHLCEEARVVVAEVCAERGQTWLEIDLDEPGAVLPDGRPVPADWSDLVPVVHVDGVRQGYWRIDADRLRAALSTPRR